MCFSFLGGDVVFQFFPLSCFHTERVSPQCIFLFPAQLGDHFSRNY